MQYDRHRRKGASDLADLAAKDREEEGSISPVVRTISTVMASHVTVLPAEPFV